MPKIGDDDNIGEIDLGEIAECDFQDRRLTVEGHQVLGWRYFGKRLCALPLSALWITSR